LNFVIADGKEIAMPKVLENEHKSCLSGHHPEPVGASSISERQKLSVRTRPNFGRPTPISAGQKQTLRAQIDLRQRKLARSYGHTEEVVHVNLSLTTK
jgi:hypothetical protein